MKVLVVLCFVAVALAEKVRQKTCVEEPVTGVCMAYFPSFYYDPATQTCKQFIYGGCGGNGNRYETEKECLSNCAGVTVQSSDVSVCGLAAETGLCRAYIPRFHFDAATGRCKQFIYGGCGGNGNNFKTHEECQQSCGASQRALNRPDCDKKGETGPCRGNFPRFYYDQEEGMCKKFTYGGCGGNRNNFETEFDCQNKCGALLSEGVSLCEQEKVVGPCKAAVPSYFFNKATGKCEFFIYGGCHGNGNRFVKQEDCENTCGVKQRALDRPDCDKKGETGPCKGNMPRFYYDQEEGMCKTFIYGGCGGNRNNFETEFDCYNKCGALLSEEVSLCEQEKVVGPCKAAFPSYFFNKATGQCEFFIYGGCQGNGNRFGRKEDCENTCGVSRSSVEVCLSEPDTGMCRGYFPRFHYDLASKSCKEFVYGGCGGNANNFETEAECKDTCFELNERIWEL